MAISESGEAKMLYTREGGKEGEGETKEFDRVCLKVTSEADHVIYCGLSCVLATDFH